MIRPVTCLCLLAAGCTGAYLYSEKHRTELLDRDIGRVIHATEAAQARTGLLRAEWALLNEPGRLQDMAGRYLTLHPMSPTQFVQVAELSGHLPAPATTPAGEAADEDEAPAPVVASIAPPTQDPAALPSHHPMQPPVKPDAHPPQKLLAKADTRHAPHHVVLADRQDAPPREAPRPMGSPLPLAAPQPMGARVYSAMARPMHSTALPHVISAVPSFAPAVSSALGGGGSLPPPVPYGR